MKLLTNFRIYCLYNEEYYGEQPIPQLTDVHALSSFPVRGFPLYSIEEGGGGGCNFFKVLCPTSNVKNIWPKFWKEICQSEEFKFGEK